VLAEFALFPEFLINQILIIYESTPVFRFSGSNLGRETVLTVNLKNNALYVLGIVTVFVNLKYWVLHPCVPPPFILSLRWEA